MDVKKQRMKLQHSLNQAEAELRDNSDELDGKQDKVDALDSAHTKTMSEITECENKLSQAKQQIQAIRVIASASFKFSLSLQTEASLADEQHESDIDSLSNKVS